VWYEPAQTMSFVRSSTLLAISAQGTMLVWPGMAFLAKFAESSHFIDCLVSNVDLEMPNHTPAQALAEPSEVKRGMKTR